MHHWEHFDARLLVCEAYLLPNSVIEASKKFKSLNKKQKFSFSSNLTNKELPSRPDEANTDLNMSSECLVVSMFFNPDNGLLVYDSYARGEIYSKLISVRIPYHFFVTKVKKKKKKQDLLKSKSFVDI